MVNQPPALHAEALTKSYGAVRALDGVSFTAQRGEVTAILGPNGAGKSTTIACATGLIAPDAGTLEVLGQDPHRADAAHRARVGVMIQDGGLASGARALQLLRYGAGLYRAPRDVDELAERLGIDAFAGTLVRRLSGGQRQRLALALAIVGRPELVFLDEPTAGMDPAIRREVRTLISQLAQEGTAVVLTTHLMDDVVGLADHVLVITRGRVVAGGTVEEVVATHQSRRGTLTLRATATGVPAAAAPALRADLEAAAARHGVALELSTGDAADLEAVLLDVMDESGRSTENEEAR
ncbi:ABC transporter ATP-binding protein [Brachybacterium phenoliresistens]|uniref:Multidrug ABC transporter ATPase n=1 Tax=Brachybacterium phenoliresistens TaxID=396014 RepID=Z9JYI7_9MICO|nr:ABC transporter ATP-binding protein [Brachybacterium phenoliresistens]EWS82862.1 multidrug ABC transporter ATPase [Brachybacterium phenoliresistens]